MQEIEQTARITCNKQENFSQNTNKVNVKQFMAMTGISLNILMACCTGAIIMTQAKFPMTIFDCFTYSTQDHMDKIFSLH